MHPFFNPQQDANGSITTRSPAKLNLFLHILGKRADHYHNLQTCFLLIDWYDVLSVQSVKNNRLDEIIVDGRYADHVPTAKTNLLHRVLDLARTTFAPAAPYLRIHLTKNIPVAAGLGGASGNAATLLLLLNEIWRLNLKITDWADLGIQLGADIPVFLHGQHSLAEGRGDILTPLIHLDDFYYLLIYPGIAHSTAEQFAQIRAAHYSKQLELQPQTLKAGFWMEDAYHNAFLTLSLSAQFKRIYDLVDQHTSAKAGGRVFMSGSGSTLFVAYERRAEMVQDRTKLITAFTKETAQPVIQSCRALGAKP